jgi:hypothetical protein
MFKPKTSGLRFLTLAFAVALAVTSWAANPYQSRNTHFGVSGGNINDISRAYCCSGTLGSLVTDGTTRYILSNNHILARQDQAAVGEDISQPGLIDNGCAVATLVADFTKASPLGSNVDAALAALRSGTMDSTGFIEGIGTISSSTLNPSVGMAVIKSGRTTGTTTGTIASVNTSVNVQYQKSCGKGRKYVVSYTNQVVINSSTFSAGGDSGSLILSNTTFHPVALLYAGSSSTTIGNPIAEVLTRLGSALGRSVSFVGSGTASPTTSATDSSSSSAQGLGLPQQAVDHASQVLEQHRHDLMSRPGVLGTGVGASDAGNQQATIVVYVNKAVTRPPLPRYLSNIPVTIFSTDQFVAF